MCFGAQGSQVPQNRERLRALVDLIYIFLGAGVREGDPNTKEGATTPTPCTSTTKIKTSSAVA